MFRLNTNSILFVSISVMASLLLILLSITVPMSLVRSEVPNDNVGNIVASDLTTEQIWVPSVGAMSDVQPTDWAFQAVLSLSERWEMPMAYPDMTFRGNNFLRRGELAQWFQGMVQRMLSISQPPEDLPTREDMIKLHQSVEELVRSVEELQTRYSN